MLRRALALLVMVGMVVGLISGPVHAAGTYNGTSGTVLCSADGFFKVVNNKVVAKSGAETDEINKCKGTAIIPDGVTEISANGLYGESLLSDIVIPDSVTVISNNGIGETALTRINLPPRLTELKQGALFFNTLLTSLIIPASVTRIETNLAFGAGGLCDVYFLGGTSPTTANGAFNGICSSGPSAGSPKAFVPSGSTSYGATFYGLTVQNSGATLLFDRNGATTGNVPANQNVAVNADFQIPANTGAGALARTNFRFNGWCTSKQDEGIGQCYTPGTSFAAPAGTTILYANWQGKPKVTYDSNGATSGSVPVDLSSPYNENSLVTVLGNTGSLQRSGYSFGGWAAAADGSGTVLQALESFNVGTTNAKLYAKWNANTNVVTYNSNSGTTVANGSFATGGQITAAPTAPTRAGYTFDGWSATDGGSLVTFPYSPGGTVAITLYAKWTVKTTGTVTYSGNGNTSGTVPVDGGSPYIFGSTVTVLANSGSLVKTGYRFIGWNTVANGSGTTYSSTGSTTFVLPSADVTLFAVWELVPVIPTPSATQTPSPSATQTPSPSATPAQSISQRPSTGTAANRPTTAAKAPISMPKFARGSTTLMDSGKAAMKKVARDAGTDSTYTVTGAAGKLPGVPTAYVEALALSRAEKLKAYLITLGVEKSNIKIKINITEAGVIPRTKIISN